MSDYKFPINILNMYPAGIILDPFFYPTAGENIIGAPKWEIILGALSDCLIFQYCDSNFRYFSIALYLVIALPTLQ